MNEARGPCQSRGCAERFGSLHAFDSHRFWVTPCGGQRGMRDRACQPVQAMLEMAWKQDSHGRWRTPGKSPGSEIQAGRGDLEPQ